MRLHKIRRLRVRNNYMKEICHLDHFFASNKKLAIQSCPKYVKAIKNLVSDKRSLHASRFTEIVVKTHENVGVVSSYLSGYLSTSWIFLNKGNRQLNLNDTDVGSYKQCLGLPTLLALLVYWKTGKFLYYLDELYGNELVFAFSLFKQH